MKRFAMMVAAVIMTATAAHAADLAWEQDYDKALASAKASKKILMVDVYTDWCGWCKKLDRDVYANPDIQAKINKNFVPLKLNPEKSQKGAQFAMANGVRGYPHIVFLDANGKPLSALVGYRPAESFSAALDDVVKKNGN